MGRKLLKNSKVYREYSTSEGAVFIRSAGKKFVLNLCNRNKRTFSIFKLSRDGQDETPPNNGLEKTLQVMPNY